MFIKVENAKNAPVLLNTDNIVAIHENYNAENTPELFILATDGRTYGINCTFDEIVALIEKVDALER